MAEVGGYRRDREHNEDSENEESFVIDSSDSEVDDPSNLRTLNNDSAKEYLADNSDDELTIEKKEDEQLNHGRLTPSIRKAIRRSLHNFSINYSSDEATEQSNTRLIPDSDEEVDLEDSIVKLKPKKKRAIESDNSDEDFVSDHEIIEESTQEPDVLPVSSDLVTRNDADESREPETVIDLDSSEDNAKISDDSPQSMLAMSIAAEECKETNLDPLIAQQKAYLDHQRNQIERKLQKKKMLFHTGNIHLLPDKGERLRLSALKDEEELETITRKLKKLESEEIGSKPPKASDEAAKKTIFIQDSLEIDPAYLKPTASDIEKDLGKKAKETFERQQELTVECLKDLHGSLLGKPSEDQRSKDPRGLKVSLMPHQQYALTWLLWREQQKPPGGVLADDMGLGKTLTMISLIMASKASSESGDTSDNEEEWLTSSRVQRHLGGTLVVAPASLVAQWESEVKNRCKRGLLVVELHHGNNRETNPKRLSKNDIVITTYNILTRDYKTTGVLYKIRWRRIVLDEAHVIRNHKSQTCESVCGLYANKRWVLTGTPIHNKEMDLFAILKFLRCSPFDDVRVWKRWVENKSDAGHKRLATVMKTIMLRRTKRDLQNDGSLEALPSKTIELIEVPLDPEERLVYDKVMVFSRTLFAQFLAQRAEKAHAFELGAGKYDKPSWEVTHKDTQFTKAQKKLLSLHADVAAHDILVLLLRLRQVCCHPSLIHSMLDKEEIEANGMEDNDPANLIQRMHNMSMYEDEDEGEIGVDERVSEHLLTSDNPVFDPKRQSSKLRAILEKIEETTATGDKVIVVSQWVGMLEIVGTELDDIENITYRWFTGKVPVKERQGIMDDFNSRNSKTNVLLLSLTAGGVGLNLVGANHLLLIDIHWNPQLECQAQDRIHRFGQKKNVFIYKYICTDTIEERIKLLQDKKMSIADSVLSGGGKVANSKLSLDEMKSLFGM